jgi:hypothetical protein
MAEIGSRRREKRLALLEVADRSVPISFAIVGVQKAGTSSLYQMLIEHPDVVGGPQKELRFFVEQHHDWSDPDYSTYRRPVDTDGGSVAGDATPAYLFYPGAIERMHRYDAAMPLMACFRDPLERAFSQWSMERRRRDYPDLPDAIDRFGGDDLPERSGGVAPARLLQNSLFSRGLYGAQLERAFATYPRDRWLLLEFRSLISEPRAVLDRATDLLGLPPYDAYPELPRRMATPTDNPGPRPSVDQVERLVHRYADDLALFERLSGLDVGDWPTRQALEGHLDLTELRDRLCDKLGLDR